MLTRRGILKPCLFVDLFVSGRCLRRIGCVVTLALYITLLWEGFGIWAWTWAWAWRFWMGWDGMRGLRWGETGEAGKRWGAWEERFRD